MPAKQSRLRLIPEDSNNKRPESKARNLQQFERFISLLVLFFCFLLFPVFIFHSALNNLFQVKVSNLRQQKLGQMQNRLEYLEKYSSNSRYLHFLLMEISEQAQKAADPVRFMLENKQNLQRRYQGDIEFIVWDAGGKVIRDLTDQKGLSYILSKLYEVLFDVSETLSADNQASISDLKSVTRNLNLIRQFLGKIFIPEFLKKPYLQGNDAGPLLTDFGGKFSSVWYRIGPRISFFCFLSERLVKGNSGLVKISSSLNGLNDDIVSGFTLSPDFSTPINEIAETHRPLLSLALSQFETFSEPVFENELALICMSMPQPGIRSFCLHMKDPASWSVELNRDVIFVRATVLLLSFYLFLFVYFKFKQQFFSIAWKLTGLFLFANLAPLAILGFIANDYLASKKEALRNEIAGDLSQTMRDFDMRYESLKVIFAKDLTRKIMQLKAANSATLLSSDDVSSIKEFIKEFQPTDAYLVASSGMVFAENTGQQRSNLGFNFIEPMSQAILKFCQGIILLRDNNDMFSPIMSPENSDFVRKAYRDSGKIIPLNTGNMRKLSFWFIFGDRKNFVYNYMLILFWEEDRFQEFYLNRNYSVQQANLTDASFFARKIDGKKSWSSQQQFPEELARQMERTTGFRENLIGSLVVGGAPHLFVGLKGKSLSNNLLAMLYPDSKLEDQIDSLRARILAGAALSLFLTLIIGQALSRQFLTPIRHLADATLAIGGRHFNHRIPIIDEDEFGHLNQVFNRVIEGLGELEVAKIVQESLFPGNNFKAGNFSIYGKSVVMTTLGGDYYDCLQINKDLWGVVIGDVAGHGVPAGLMMAMAKASVLMAPEHVKIDAAALTARLHHMFFAIKNDRLKRMMTFQYFVMKPDDGSFSFANAGHCFPILVKPALQSAELIEHVATPLGIGPRARYKNFECRVEPGESLLLYTDGIAEAKNAQGEEFGYERLKQLALDAFDPDPEAFYRKIFAAYENWSARPDDDLTIILVNHNV
ncbi:MAG: SpoIIE family protein phosphatase [Candidatus Riflebacteria bacterium]|nr:SpoIIE family protein phosphatase [Candidatus Riflebacteria bacterium]